MKEVVDCRLQIECIDAVVDFGQSYLVKEIVGISDEVVCAIPVMLPKAYQLVIGYPVQSGWA